VRIVFLGTPEFALPSLEAVLGAGDVDAVITRPDTRSGRGLQMESPAVAVMANQYALEVLQPVSLRDPAVLRRLRDLAPDVFVAVAYGRLIPEEVLAVAPLGGINLHPSLLPRYRGAAPIARAIAAGETMTGVTVIELAREMDAGDILLQREVPISLDDTTGTLERRLAEEGATLLVEALRLLDEGRASRRPQDPAQATMAPKVSRDEALIRWWRGSREIVNLIRAFDPWPVAYTLLRGEELRVWRAAAIAADPGGITPPQYGGGFPQSGDRSTEVGRPSPGTVLSATGDPTAPIIVAAGTGCVVLREVQPASGRRMSAADYLRGHPIPAGTVLGNGSAG